ncbi:hypothetical protein BDR06DRAFT_964059 [Suillus hirtellus]|nr:hypothetical protein BDR06DRAFT_964059 [Suillus hirtellus]
MSTLINVAWLDLCLTCAGVYILSANAVFGQKNWGKKYDQGSLPTLRRACQGTP